MGKYSDIKGFVGEYKIQSSLDALKRYNVKYLYNVVLPKDDKDITQVDFMIFSPKCCICLEVKAWSGKIIIPQSGNTWKLVYGTQEIRAVTPFQQNRAHLRVVKRLSPNKLDYKDFIVFPENPIIINKQSNMGNIPDLIQFIMSGKENYRQEVVDSEYNYFMNISNENYSNYMLRELSRIHDTKDKTNYFGGD
jgi:hypothetical protein